LGLGAARARGRLALAEGIEPERFPAALAVKRMLRPVDELGAVERVELGADDAPVLLQHLGEREPRGVVIHGSPVRTAEPAAEPAEVGLARRPGSAPQRCGAAPERWERLPLRMQGGRAYRADGRHGTV